ncbi:MAG: sigma-70 family RNA polymerase sigma factor [Anaerococcus vaginalis]|uniref:sigma-70 family RNA polymerase sigma factor n=1 Tax=Anaerococcus vaginalis TaxID=33037 RepID=UPI0028893FA1|nr:sigma-70 family RNA polymerase sigma factor [Anaerococcus vaginalis]MDU4379198.1 sigma-70 family RNA polymerase sigma factor [Anaerococcus vaginalis]MDU5085703.1 sigma-70 family RNA polymerase sigma factor [Anaerococcus vaginalis]MDU5559752.1 sigma-70 family RNA polymerase sigma factor [Anaerococcus vaginalis]MDU5824320.1 sigma-70 family RNA polymerase sigma factor [Anaerococcus vaginalis]MDU7143662.1 sigma-70 family RNA polymerase sigma factor [Anaerococcus vaginalis]
MDKIDFNDEEVFEKFKDFFDEDDIDEKQAQKIYKGLTEEEKEEFEQFLEDEELEIEEEEDRKKIKNSIVARQRSDIIRLSDLTNEQIVEQFQEGNQNALGALVDKNQGLVRSRASYFYRSHGNDLELEDLVQSGMLGMIRAAEKFDLTLGYKFTTYAYKWIDKAIRKAINKEGHTIRIPAGKYLKLNKLKQILKANPEASEEELYKILKQEGIDKKQADDLFLINRNQVNSTSLNINLDSEDSTGDELMDMVGDDSIPVDDQILKKDMEDFLMKALDQLSDREKQIIIYRYGLDNEKPKTLEEIGTIYNLSRERIRQIENQALGKLKQYSDQD